MPKKPKTKLSPKLKKHFEKELWQRLGGKGKPSKALIARRDRAGAAIERLTARTTGIAVVTAEVTSKEIPNFTWPNIGEDGTFLEPPYITGDATVGEWVANQLGKSIFFQYRLVGSDQWLTPTVVYNNSQVGKRAVVLPSGAYEFFAYEG